MNLRLQQVLDRLRGREEAADDVPGPLPASVRLLQQAVLVPDMGALAETQPARVEALLREAGAGGGLDCWIAQGEWAGATLLWVACRTNCLPMVRLLVRGGADVNRRCHSEAAAWRREAPLHTAARFGHHEVLAFLLQVPGIQVHRFKDDGATPVFLSVQEGHVDATRVLVAARADVNVCRFDGTPPLIMAAQNDRHACLAWLCRDSGLPRVQPCYGPDEAPPTDGAALQSWVAPKPWLDVNVRDARGVVPLMASMINDSSNCFEVLVAVPETDVFAENEWGQSCLEYALACRRPELALHVARRHGSTAPRIRTMLLLNRAVTGGVDYYGWRPDQVEQAKKVVDLLLEASNPFAWTPEQFAKHGSNNAAWWSLVNGHKKWSPATHHHFPPEFRSVAFTFLLCMKRLAPGLRYPVPKPIQHDILRHLSVASFSDLPAVCSEPESASNFPHYLDDMRSDDEVQEELQQYDGENGEAAMEEDDDHPHTSSDDAEFQ